MRKQNSFIDLLALSRLYSPNMAVHHRPTMYGTVHNSQRAQHSSRISTIREDGGFRNSEHNEVLRSSYKYSHFLSYVNIT